MSRRTLCMMALASALAAGCSDSNNWFGSSKKSSDRSGMSGQHTVMMTDVPANVQESFRRDHPYATTNNVTQQNFKDGRTYYVFKYKDREGKSKQDTYNARAMKVDD